MTVTETPPVRLLALGNLEDPYAQFAEWRAAGPLVHGLEGWGVTRHVDVSALLRDRRIGHAFPRFMLEYAFGDGATTDFQTNSLLNRDDDDHTRLRRLMGQAFSAPLVRKMREHIGELVDELLEPMLDGEVHDIVDALAFPLPSAVICELLDIDKADRDEVRDQTTRFNTQDVAAMDAGMEWFRDYMSAVLAERTADPEGDLFQRMLAAEDGADRLTHQEIVDNAILLFFAGFETTKNVIASGVAALLEFPDQQALLWSHPELAASAVEEFLRYDAPVRFAPRVTVADVEIGGEVIPAGRFVQLHLGSANRDERVFADPDRLDITRSPNPHVAFGGGVHHCLGAMLARVEGEVVFRRLAQRLGGLEPAGEPTKNVGAGLGTYTAVPVRATAA
jgi:cytochrome P450